MVKCKHCGKDFEGEKELFCSEICHDAFDLDVQKRVEEAIK